MVKENYEEIKKKIFEQILEKFKETTLLRELNNVKNIDELNDFIIKNVVECNNHNVLLPDGKYKNKKREFSISDGKLHGEFVQYHNNGQVYLRCSFLDGKQHGKYTFLTADGAFITRGYYNQGLRHGEHVEYRNNMKVWFKCNYDNDELHGEYILYDKKGELEAKRFYENGKLVKTQRPFKKRIIRLLKGDF